MRRSPGQLLLLLLLLRRWLLLQLHITPAPGVAAAAAR